ncbi:Uncharacterised protein [Vibrio cholerae]|nr:Uncharacterised protein [Vibrio cholerae]
MVMLADFIDIISPIYLSLNGITSNAELNSVGEFLF